MPSKGWYVNGLDELLEDSIDRMKDFNSQYMRDMRSVFTVEKVFQGIDMNEYSIPDLKKMALDTIHKKNLLDPAHGGKLPILCKDKRVRYYNPEQWSETIARTRSRALQEKGLHDEMAEAGFDLVIVSIGGSGDMCKHWEGKILSISGKTPGYQTVTEAQGIHLFHPNCVHSTSPIVATQDVETGETVIWGRDFNITDLKKRAAPVMAAQASVGALKEKINWAVSEFVEKGKSKGEAIKGLMGQYPDMKEGYAKAIVYRHMKGYTWGIKKPVSEVIEKVVEKEIVKKTTTGSAFIKEEIKKYKASGKWEELSEVGKSVMIEARARGGSTLNNVKEILDENRKFGGDIKYIKGSARSLEPFFARAAGRFPTDWWDDFNAAGKSKIKAFEAPRGYWKVNKGAGVKAGDIALSGNYTDTAAHELGHMFEEYRSTPISEKARRKRLKKTVTDFRESRVGNEATKWLGPGYAETEKGWRDKFSKGYIGKYYSDGATEIFSEGIQSLHSGLGWGSDEEMDEFIIGILLCL